MIQSAGRTFESVDVGSQTALEGDGDTARLTLKCVVNRSVQFTAIIVLYGERGGLYGAPHHFFLTQSPVKSHLL